MIAMDITIFIFFFSVYNMTSVVNYESIPEWLFWTHFNCQNVHRDHCEAAKQRCYPWFSWGFKINGRNQFVNQASLQPLWYLICRNWEIWLCCQHFVRCAVEKIFYFLWPTDCRKRNFSPFMFAWELDCNFSFDWPHVSFTGSSWQFILNGGDNDI